MTRSMRAVPALACAAICALHTTAVRAQALEPYQVPIWTGAYAGLHGGVNRLGVDTSYGDDSFSNGFGGVHVGINMQYGMIVLGGEADLNYETAASSAAIDGADFGVPSLTATAKAEQKASGSFRARIGVPVAPELLLYATGGYAWTTLDYSVAGTLGGSPFESGSGETFGGFVYGIGAEMQIAPQVLLRIEALRYDYSEQSYALSPGGADTISIDPSSDVIRAGVSWRFN